MTAHEIRKTPPGADQAEKGQERIEHSYSTHAEVEMLGGDDRGGGSSSDSIVLKEHEAEAVHHTHHQGSGENRGDAPTEHFIDVMTQNGLGALDS